MLPRWIAAVLSVPLLACAAGLAATTGQVVPVESFEEYPLLAFPGQWIVRGDKDQARLIYQVAEVKWESFPPCLCRSPGNPDWPRAGMPTSRVSAVTLALAGGAVASWWGRTPPGNSRLCGRGVCHF